MDRKPTPTKQTNSERAAFRMLVLSLAAAILIPVLTVVLLVQSLSPDRPIVDGTEPPRLEQPTTPATPEDTTPVFAGGVIPTMPTPTAATVALSGLNSTYAMLVRADTGEIVAAIGDDVPFSPASMTKVMTLIVAAEHLTVSDMDKRMTMSQDLSNYVQSGNYKGLTISFINAAKELGVGDAFLIKDLFYAIGVTSAADASMMIASYVCPRATLAESEAAFVALMNQKAEALGLQNTRFDNVVGYGSDGNVTTAREMAVIMMYAMQSAKVADVLGKKEMSYTAQYYVGDTLKSYTGYLKNTFFVDRINSYEDHFGTDFVLPTATLYAGKTGYLTSSYLVCAARSKTDGAGYVLVLGNAPKSYHTMADVKTLLDTYVN